MSKPSEPPISNLVLAGLGALFIATVSLLGGLFYNLRPKKIVIESKPEPVATASAPNVRTASEVSDENTSTFRIAARSEDASPPEIAAASTQPAKPGEAAAPVEATTPAPNEPATVAAAAATPPEADSNLSLEERLQKDAAAARLNNVKDNNELVPELKGMSYTAKKAAANGGDAYASSKPVAKKAEVKKPVTPPAAKIPVKPEPAKPVVAKIEPPKSTTPAPLTAAELAKFNIAKSPIYVLKDGRRLRALMAKDDGVTITIRNEVGASISFKKSEIKEILRG